MDRFLARMRISGNVTLSCNAAGIARTTAYRWRDQWATFAKEWDDAKEEAVDYLDAEAWKRGTVGQSDRLLMFLLAAHRPDVYGRQRHEHSGPDGGPIPMIVVNWDDPTGDDSD